MARYEIKHLYSGNKIHVWYTDDPEAYLAEVKVKAPFAELISVEEVPELPKRPKRTKV